MPRLLHGHQLAMKTQIKTNIVELDIGNYPTFSRVNPLVKWGIA